MGVCYLIEQAKRLIDLGLPLIPLCDHQHEHSTAQHIQRCACAGKTPLIRGWQNRDNTTIRHLLKWEQDFRGFNIGLPLGSASGYCGIDIDGAFGEESLKEMSGGILPDTWEFSTGAGRRLLYTIPHGTKTKKFKDAKDGGGHEECAILCDGQQTVMPPSIHHTGSIYDWAEGKSPWDLDCAPAPRWLMDLITVDETDSFANEFSMDDEFDFSPAESAPTMEDEFDAFEFKDDIPPDSVINKNKVKTQKGKTGHAITVSEEMLTSPILAGQRDVTMAAIVGHYCANRDLRRLGKSFILDICLKHNATYVQPPLDDAEIENKVNYFFELEAMKESQYKTGAEGKKVFEPSTMAAIVKKEIENKGLLMHFDQSSKMYYYTSPEKGPWVCTRNVTLVNKWIRTILKHPTHGASTWDKSSYIDETRRALEEMFTEAYKEFDDFDIGAHSDELSKYIVVNNGMLDWELDTLVEWNPKYFTTVAYDVDYIEDAKCPRFEGYMADWIPSAEVRMVVQEFMGYCLIPNTKFRKAMFMYGKGRNGKSMLLEFLQDFFGDNKSTLAYDTLFQRFGPANLKGKVVNIYDDTSVSFVKDTGIIKNLIAGGTIAAEFKGRDHFTFTNVARFIFSAQETPKTSDHTEAWYDRWIFVNFPNKFRASNKVKTEMETAMREEKEGIFNWMIEGLKRLMEQDGFTHSKDLLLSAQDYRGQNDAVARFVQNMCQEGQGVSVNTLYKLFGVWSDYEGLRPMSKRVFAERVEDLGYHKAKGYIDGRSGQTYFSGIEVDKNSEDYEENKLDYTIAYQTM